MSDGVPLLGDIPLDKVQRIEHFHEAGFAPLRIAGLAGELQQQSGRPSHRIHIAGALFGAAATDDLKKLQTAAAGGAELTFASDITSALDLQKVVITSFRAIGLAGRPNTYQYEIALAESPPLPPPATLDAFGGLGDFGLGDLGFDTDILGDLQSLAGEVAGAVNDALDVIDALSALSNLDNLSLGNALDPINQAADQVGAIAAQFKDLGQKFEGAFS